MEQGSSETIFGSRGTGGVQTVMDQLRGIPDKVVKEMISYDYLKSELQGGVALPPAGGWAATYETIAYLVRHILNHEEPCVVLEAGSGISTVWMGLALQRAGRGTLLSLEHLQDHYSRTSILLEKLGVSEFVELRLAPLTTYVIHGEEYDWYSYETLPDDVNLVFVDGPPGTLGHEARYPCFPLVAPFLRDDALVVLDDSDRPHEQRVAQRWMGEVHTGRTLSRRESTSRSWVLELAR